MEFYILNEIYFAMRFSFLLILSFFWSHLLNGQSADIDNYLSAPYCSQLVKSSDGTAIAWLSEQKGERTIYVGKAPEFKGTVAFSSDGDDGQVIGNMKFSNDNSKLYFIHGSDRNREGVSANPASFVDFPTQQLKRIELSSGEVKSIGMYSQYFISSNDQFIIAPSANHLFKIDAKSFLPTKLISMRGIFADLSLSKNGQKVLFTSNRGDHSYIGTYTIGEKESNGWHPVLIEIFLQNGRQMKVRLSSSELQVERRLNY